MDFGINFVSIIFVLAFHYEIESLKTDMCGPLHSSASPFKSQSKKVLFSQILSPTVKKKYSNIEALESVYEVQ